MCTVLPLTINDSLGAPNNFGHTRLVRNNNALVSYRRTFTRHSERDAILDGLDPPELKSDPQNS